MSASNGDKCNGVIWPRIAFARREVAGFEVTLAVLHMPGIHYSPWYKGWLGRRLQNTDFGMIVKKGLAVLVAGVDGRGDSDCGRNGSNEKSKFEHDRNGGGQYCN